MEINVLDRNFSKQDSFDQFQTAIWTERYYGDGDFQFTTNIDTGIMQLLSKGTLVNLEGSNEIMIVDTFDIEDNLKIVGTSLLQWLNNRFIRAIDGAPERAATQFANLTNMVPGYMLQYIVQNTCIDGTWLNSATGAQSIPLAQRQKFKLPGLAVGDYVKNGPAISLAVPYGPVFDGLLDIATTYGIGMQIYLNGVQAVFRNYLGLDRSSRQSVVPVIRFSEDTQSFIPSSEIQSLKNYKTNAYTYAPLYPWNANVPTGESTRPDPGISKVSDDASGWDLRAIQVFANDLTTFISGDGLTNPPGAAYLQTLVNRSIGALLDNAPTNAISGEASPSSQFNFGTDYNLGDVVEVQGKTDAINYAQVTEYIRAKDATGERGYPTVTVLN